MTGDDEDIVRLTLEGNPEAFEEIVHKYERAIFNAAFRILNDNDDAADAVQSTFLKAYRNLDHYNSHFRFFSWLYKIAINESLNSLRQRKSSDPVDAESTSSGETPEDQYRSVELGEKIQEALMELGLDYRLVIILSHFEELSYREVGYVLDLPEKTVKSRLFTARKQLRDVLLKNGVQP